MVTGIQSRAYGLNIEFHIELRFRKKKKRKWFCVTAKLTAVAALDSS